jgi:hypothetical protein
VSGVSVAAVGVAGRHELSADHRLGVKEAFEVLNHTRASMLTLFNMYVTGSGIFVVAVATVESVPTRIKFAVLASFFIAANLAGFFSNLRFQKVVYTYLADTIPVSEPSHAVLRPLKPFPLMWFIPLYIVVSAALLSLSVFISNSVSSPAPNHSVSTPSTLVR